MDDMRNLLNLLWMRELELDENVTDDDSFFELGGNSLKAFRLTESLKDQAGVEILISDVYEYDSFLELLQFICKSAHVSN